MADVSYYLCSTCHEQFDLDEGGFLWQGFVFCENCDPEECPENCEECNIEGQWGAPLRSTPPGKTYLRHTTKFPQQCRWVDV